VLILLNVTQGLNTSMSEKPWWAMAPATSWVSCLGSPEKPRAT
jgi:hypothetical protein